MVVLRCISSGARLARARPDGSRRRRPLRPGACPRLISCVFPASAGRRARACRRGCSRPTLRPRPRRRHSGRPDSEGLMDRQTTADRASRASDRSSPRTRPHSGPMLRTPSCSQSCEANRRRPEHAAGNSVDLRDPGRPRDPDRAASGRDRECVEPVDQLTRGTSAGGIRHTPPAAVSIAQTAPRRWQAAGS